MASLSYSVSDGFEVINSTFSPPSPLYQALVQYVFPISFLLISIGGLIGNGLVIFCLLRFNNLKTVPNIYILNLAVIDFFFLLSLPFMSFQYITNDWPFGLVVCKFTIGMNTLNQYASSWTLVAMSADRFMAVVYPLASMQRRTRSCARMVCTVVLLWALVLSSVDWIIAEVQTFRHAGRPLSFCTMRDPEYIPPFTSIYMSLNFTLGFALPLIGILFFYISIVAIMRNNNFYFGSDAKTAAQRASKRVAVLTIAVIVVFIICWLPYYAFQLKILLSTDKATEVASAFHQLSIVWCYMNSMFNPFIYTFVGENFRKNMAKICACWSQSATRRRSGRDSSIYTKTTNRVPLKRHQTRNTYCNSDVTNDIHVPHEHNNNAALTTVM